MVPTLGGGTQVTDFNKGFTEGFFLQKIFGEEMGVGSGGPRPPYEQNLEQIGFHLEKINSSRQNRSET